MWRCWWSGSEFMSETWTESLFSERCAGAAFRRSCFRLINSLTNLFIRLLGRHLTSAFALVWVHPAAFCFCLCSFTGKWKPRFMQQHFYLLLETSTTTGKTTDGCSAQLRVEVMLLDSEQPLCTAHWWKRARMILMIFNDFPPSRSCGICTLFPLIHFVSPDGDWRNTSDENVGCASYGPSDSLLKLFLILV